MQQELENALLAEIARAMALPSTTITRRMVRLVFGRAARRFSELVTGFDREIERNGSAAGARWLLPSFVAGYEARGQGIVPPEGSLLIVSNHPASYDGLVITACINRPDFKVIIGEIPPYRHLPNVSRHVIFSPPVANTFGRMQTVRNAIRHLNDGGALLIFPRGGIEPDPSFMPDAGAEFDKWSRSLEIFLERVPRTRVLVAIVGGVIAPAAMRHPITWFRNARPDRQRLAFILQIIHQISSGRESFGLTPQVTFGELLSSVNQKIRLPDIVEAERRTLIQHLSNL
jgi:hypothetical protein